MNKKLNKRELAQIEFDKIEYDDYFKNIGKGYYLFRDSFDTLSEELKDIAFEHAIMNDYGFWLISSYFDKLTPAQKEKALNNAIEEYYYHQESCIFENFFDILTPAQREKAFKREIKNDKGSYLFENCFDKLSKHQKLIAFENALDKYTFENIITEDGYEIEHYSIFSYFPVAKDNIKKMILDFKKEEENNE